METPNIFKTEHDYNYCLDREKTAAYWAKHNIFNMLGVDAFGVRFKGKNCLTTHHIYINKRTTCVGLIPLSSIIHRYLDDYLMWKDFDEYERWNLYLKKVYDYIYQNDISININDLIKEKNILLRKVLSDKDNKTYSQYENLEPLIKCALNNVLYENQIEIMKRAFNYSKTNSIFQIYPYSFSTFDKLLNKGKLYYEIDSLISIKRHIEDVIDNCKNISFDINEVISNRYRYIFEYNDDNNTINITTAVNKYLDNHPEKLRYDWMKNIISSEGTSSDEYLLTNQSINLLLYLHEKNIVLFNLWEKVLNRCKNEDYIGEDIIMLIDTLRRLTFEFIEEEMNKDNNNMLAADVVTNINKNYVPSIFDDPDINHVCCLEFINRITDLKRQKREMRRIQKFKEEFFNKNKRNKIDDTYIVNFESRFLERKLNNDYMGDTFIDSLDIDYSFGPFVSKNSSKILSYLKRKNEGLYNAWRSFFEYLEKYVPQLNENEEFKKLYLLNIHRRFTNLKNRSLTLIKENYILKKDISTSDYYKMISILSNDDVRFYIKSINDVYDSKVVERLRIERYGCIQHLESKYNNKLENILGDNSFTENNRMHMSKKSNRFIYKNMNKDWMGFDLTLNGNEIMDDEVLNDQLFLTDDSRELLSIIKKKKKRLYNEIIDLLSRIPIDNPDNKPFGFDIRMDNLLYDAYCSLNKCRKEFNEKQEEVFIRLRDVIYK